MYSSSVFFQDDTKAFLQDSRQLVFCIQLNDCLTLVRTKPVASYLECPPQQGRLFRPCQTADNKLARKATPLVC
jgi:hypothetical protein